MKRIDTINARENMFGVGKSGFHDNADLPKQDATYVSPDWFNTVQEELCNLLELSDIAVNPESKQQLFDLLITRRNLVNDLTTGGIDKAITAEQIKLFYAKFASLQTDNGYLKIPTSDGNQIILQWCIGTTVPASGTSLTTLPLSFTTACFFATAIGVGAPQGVSEIISKTKSTITFGSGNNVTINNPLVFAIGK